MSRKSDIEKLYNWVQFRRRIPGALRATIEAAYNLGRAAQAEKDAEILRLCGWFECADHSRNIAKRLRAKVRKAAGEHK